MADLNNILRPSPFVKASYWFVDPTISSPAEDIESSLFTHLFCAFADVNRYTYEVDISKNYSQISRFTEIVQRKNYGVQTLLSIGGKMAEPTVIPTMASNGRNRKAFIDSSIKIAREYNFYGLDLAWEYPRTEMDMDNFGKLVAEWRMAIDEESNRTRQQPLLLTAAVYYSPVYNSAIYRVQPMKQNLDWVNLIAFEFYGSSTSIGSPAALYDPYSNPEGPCGDSGLKQWIKAGFPEKKVVFGIPYVGWKWSVEGGYDATATTRVAISADGPINYDKIRSLIDNHQAKTVYDGMVVGDYCFTDTMFIGYDDIFSVVTKVRYTKLSGLLGYFAWNVGADVNSTLSRTASKAWDA